MSVKILGIVPARGGSKRVPGKNKKKLHGKELVRYAIEAALGSKIIDQVVVSTDDDDILEIAKSYESIIAIKRPDELSGDEAVAVDYVLHALEVLETSFSHTVIIQPTSPFTLSDDIDQTVNLLLKNGAADSSVSVMKLDHAIHPVKLKTLEGDKLLPLFEEEKGRMAAHELTEVYVRNCSVYVSKLEVIKDRKIIGDVCLGFEMPRERSLDINDPIDFEFAEFIMSKLKSK